MLGLYHKKEDSSMGNVAHRSPPLIVIPLTCPYPILKIYAGQRLPGVCYIPLSKRILLLVQHPLRLVEPNLPHVNSDILIYQFYSSAQFIE